MIRSERSNQSDFWTTTYQYKYDIISHGRWLFKGSDWQYLIVMSYPRRSADTILVHIFKIDYSSQQRKKGFPTIFACVYHFTRSFSTIHEDAVCKTRHWIKQLFLLCFETCVRGFFHGCLIQWVNIANDAYIFAKKFDVSDEFFFFCKRQNHSFVSNKYLS